MSTTIRVSERSRDRLAALARSTGRPMNAVVEDAIDALERRVFFDQLNARFGELRAAAQEWSAIVAERRLEEGAVEDRSS